MEMGLCDKRINSLKTSPGNPVTAGGPAVTGFGG